jgi:phosphoribosylformylglycinamidine synthase
LGGIAIALAESCLKSSLGAEVELKSDIRSDCCLFGETQSRIIVSIDPSNIDNFIKIARSDKIPFQRIGMVKGNHLKINQWVNLPLEELEKSWRCKGN